MAPGWVARQGLWLRRRDEPTEMGRMLHPGVATANPQRQLGATAHGNRHQPRPGFVDSLGGLFSVICT